MMRDQFKISRKKMNKRRVLDDFLSSDESEAYDDSFIDDDCDANDDVEEKSVISILDDSSSSSLSLFNDQNKLKKKKDTRVKNKKASAEIGNLADMMETTGIGPKQVCKTPTKQNKKQSRPIFHIDDSDSDSSMEVLLKTPIFNRMKKPTTSIDDDHSSSEEEKDSLDHRSKSGSIKQKTKALKATKDKKSQEPTKTPEFWVLDSKRNEYFLSSTDTRMPKFRIPAKLYGQLFDHQYSGVSWMAGLHHQGVGGLLGDDMGMGKTYMTLTFLGGLMRARTISNALIVAPLSVLRSWEREASKVVTQCVPSIRTISVSSSMNKVTRCRHLKTALECSSNSPCIIITTYGLIGSSPMDFMHEEYDYSWDYIVLDEAHKIKNPAARVSKSCRQIASDSNTRRLILTGTPIMNNLKELWALFDFATSGKVLGTLPMFKNQFSSPIEDARSADATGHTIRIGEKANQELQEKIKPYFLQRLKIDFLADKLPTKTDFVVWTHLSKFQRAMYSRYVNSGDSAVAQVLSGISTSPLEAVTWLKKLCGHPILLEKENQHFDRMSPEKLKRNSSKLQVLDTLVERLRRKGHRTLIFSQSTKMLDIIERVLSRMRLSRIDGNTKERDRQRRVDDFNEKDDVEVMLLSTKAAGVGLTLTGANRAIIYDPSWNPAEDSQAIDRCYRIGQKKEVVVFRFITAGSVEEKMYEKQVHKDGLRRAVMTSMGNETMRYFDKESLRKLFTLGEEGVCEFLERLKRAGLASSEDSPEVELTSHQGMIGVSSHDQLYTSNKLIDITNGNVARDYDCGSYIKLGRRAHRENPFSSPAPPAMSSRLEAATSDRTIGLNSGPSKVDAQQENSSQSKLLGRSCLLGSSHRGLSNRQGLPSSSTSKLLDRSRSFYGCSDSQISQKQGLMVPSKNKSSDKSKLLERSKVLGRSNRVMGRCSDSHTGYKNLGGGFEAQTTNEKGNRRGKTDEEEVEESDDETSNVSSEETLQTRKEHRIHWENSTMMQQTISSVFQRVDHARAIGKHALAMELLMDFLDSDYSNLPKVEKMEVHKRAALISYELQWL